MEGPEQIDESVHDDKRRERLDLQREEFGECIDDETHEILIEAGRGGTY